VILDIGHRRVPVHAENVDAIAGYVSCRDAIERV
jgi:CBS domain containing-hemolysin-like protein